MGTLPAVRQQRPIQPARLPVTIRLRPRRASGMVRAKHFGSEKAPFEGRGPLANDAEQPGERPLSADPPRLLSVHEVCARFEGAWKAGQRPRIEEHLAAA